MFTIVGCFLLLQFAVFGCIASGGYDEQVSYPVPVEYSYNIYPTYQQQTFTATVPNYEYKVTFTPSYQQPSYQAPPYSPPQQYPKTYQAPVYSSSPQYQTYQAPPCSNKNQYQTPSYLAPYKKPDYTKPAYTQTQQYKTICSTDYYKPTSYQYPQPNYQPYQNNYSPAYNTRYNRNTDDDKDIEPKALFSSNE